MIFAFLLFLASIQFRQEFLPALFPCWYRGSCYKQFGLTVCLKAETYHPTDGGSRLTFYCGSHWCIAMLEALDDLCIVLRFCCNVFWFCRYELRIDGMIFKEEFVTNKESLEPQIGVLKSTIDGKCLFIYIRFSYS